MTRTICYFNYKYYVKIASFKLGILIGCWKGVPGHDLSIMGEEQDQTCNQPVESGQYCEQPLSDCNRLCEDVRWCKSFHFHPRIRKHFANCNLKEQEYTSQLEITNTGGDWTLYWYDPKCTGNLFHF